MATWDTSELDQLQADLAAAGPDVQRGCELVEKKAGFETVAGAQALVPVDTGNLKGTIGVDVDGLSFEAGPTSDYGAHVEYGTAAHVIRARNAGALWWPGARHPVKSVNHPGTPPKPYMRPAFDRAVEAVPEALGQV